MSLPKPTEASLRDAALDALLHRHLPDDTDPKAFLQNPTRQQFVYGLRAFEQALKTNQKAIARDLNTPAFRSLLYIDEVQPLDTLSPTNIAFLLNPKIGGQLRAISSPRFRTIVLAHYLIQKSKGAFAIREEQGCLTFWNNGHRININSPSLLKKEGRGRRPLTESALAGQDAPEQREEWPVDAQNRYFLAFYWRPGRRKNRDKVGYAIVKAPLMSKSVEESWNETQITYYYTQGQHTTLVTEANASDKRTLSLRLTDAPGQQRAGVWTQITLDWTGPNDPIYTGVFASLSGHDRFQHPAGGLIVWWRQPSAEHCADLIKRYMENPEEIPVEVFHFLLERRVDVPVQDGAIESLEALPRMRNVRLLAGIAQAYQGYFVHPATGIVSLFSCRISAAGRVECRYPNNHKHPKLAGFTSPFAHGVQIDLHYVADSGAYRLHYFLEGALTTGRYLLGIYAGFDHSLTHPTSGRVVLQAIADEQEPLVTDIDISEFSADPNNTTAMGYLTGELGLPTATDSLVVDQLKWTRRANLVAPLAGRYDLYMTERLNSDDPPEVFRHNLVITDSGMAILSGNGREGQGPAILTSDHLLMVQFEATGKGQVQGTLLVSLCDIKGYLSRYEQIQHLFGMATFVDQLRIMSMVVVLKATPTNNPDVTPVDPLPIRFSRTMAVTQFNLTTADFNSYDSQLSGMLSTLEGEAYRLIRLPKTPNHPFRPRRDKDRRGPFFAACYRAKFYNQAPSESLFLEIESYLEDAYTHGFATLRFGGESVRDLSTPFAAPDRVRQYMRKHNIHHTYLKKIQEDFRSLSQDFPLLLTAYDDLNGLGSLLLRGLVERFWGDLNDYRTPDTVPQQNQKPEIAFR